MKNRVNYGYFVLGIVAIIAICFSGGLTFQDGKSVSVLGVLIRQDEWTIMQTTWLDAFNAGIYGWLFLLLPVIAVVPTLTLICSEINSRYYHLIIGRIGLRKYIWKTNLTAYVSAVLMVALGLLLYAGIVGIFFPATHDFGDISVYGLEELGVGQIILEEGKGLVRMALIGGFMATFACMIAGVCQNIYIILCLPFLLNYILESVILQTGFLLPVILTLICYMLGREIWYWRYRRLMI